MIRALGELTEFLARGGLEVGRQVAAQARIEAEEGWHRVEDRFVPRLPPHLQRIAHTLPVLGEALGDGHWHVAASMLGPAWRGFVLEVGKHQPFTQMPARYRADFSWEYHRDRAEMARLYDAAKKGQWNAATDIDWSLVVEPQNPDKPILPDSYIPMADLAVWRGLDPQQQAVQRHAMLSWVLSQFLHGEQGALMASAQVTSAVPWLEAKQFGATQVVDEARHVEAFLRYLDEKLQRRYQINDNLYVLIDALMNTAEWDLKYLGMQIMIEGLALGAFGTLRQVADDTLLKGLLRYVIRDEARHVRYGVFTLEKYYKTEISEKERRFREEWAFEVARLMRSRFLAHEIFDEYYGHRMTRREWDRLVGGSSTMALFRETMFRQIMPNLRQIGLLGPRIQPYYDELGLMGFASGPAAPDLAEDGSLSTPS